MPPHRPLAIAPLLALGALAACGEPASDSEWPQWIELAAGFRPRPLAEVAADWGDASDVTIRAASEDADAWIETTIPRSAWQRHDDDGHWVTRVPRRGALAYVTAVETRLASEGIAFHAPKTLLRSAPGDFLVNGERLFIALGDEPAPPERITYAVRVSNGARGTSAWRLTRDGRVGDGIPVWSGSYEELAVSIAPRARLLFDLAWSRDEGDATLRVLIDDAELARIAIGETSHHSVELPPEGRASARLRFEVEGDPGRALLFTPTIAPLDVGDYRARPWADAAERRPDLVLFLADTFRADGLEIHGGTGRTPNIDAFARRARRFLAARSSATSTLPSISTMLTGLHPGQHGATYDGLAPAPELTTVAELFQRAGYRTGAITDGGFFSRRIGLDRGFATFVEKSFTEETLADTVDAAIDFLEQDDGRPVFLVVHTYRAHSPYRTGEEESDGHWNELVARALEDANMTSLPKVDDRREVFLAYADELRALYDEGVAALDAGFGRLIEATDRLHLLESGNVLFTADHGEAFGENGYLGHGQHLWDSMLHVPLLIAGRAIRPSDVPWTVSLVDMAPTLGQLAGITHDGWTNRSLLDATDDRTALAFLLRPDERRVALARGDRKVIADAASVGEGRFVYAFELAEDRGEESPVPPESEWARALCRASADEVAAALAPRQSPVAADGRDLTDLAALGYVARDEKPRSAAPKDEPTHRVLRREADGRLLLARGARDDQFGRALAAGDVDGDGILDLIVGAEHAQGTAAHARRPGCAYVISGAELARARRGEAVGDEAWIRTVNGAADHNEFGITVAVADLDLDGHADLIVGSPMEPPAATVLSGRTGEVLVRIPGPSGVSLFGYDVNVADLDGDGRDDVLVGAPSESSRAPRAGAVFAYTIEAEGDSGALRATLAYSYHGPDANDSLGLGIVPLDDVDGDGKEDWAVGAPMVAAERLERSSYDGAVHVVSGATGRRIAVQRGASEDGPTTNGLFGLDGANVGDVDGDGVADAIFGAPRLATEAGSDAGRAALFSGADLRTPDARPLRVVDGRDAAENTGHASAGVGDFDGDGWRDYAVGAKEAHRSGPSAGNLRVFSGRDGSLLLDRDGAAESAGTYGYAIVGLGDLDGDGHDDLAVSAPHDDRFARLGGIVEVIFGFAAD